MAKNEPAAKQETVTRLPPRTLLGRLRSMKKSMDSDINAVRGTYGQAVADAVENKHLHKKAWSTAMREDKMEPEQLKLYYEHLDHYRDELGLIKRADSAPDLPMDGEDGDGEEDEKKGNVKQFPAPSSVAAE